MSREIEQILKNQVVIMGMLQDMQDELEPIQNIEDTHQLLVDKNNGWIPCSKRLPEDGTRVIACFKHGLVTELKYKSAGIFEGTNEYVAEVIDSWQPLPEPYRKEQKDGR